MNKKPVGSIHTNYLNKSFSDEKIIFNNRNIGDLLGIM